MTVRDILIYSQHKAELRRKSEPVAGLNKRVMRLILDLKDTLQASSDGIGLAAPQINRHQRVVVVRLRASSDGSEEPNRPLHWLTPRSLKPVRYKKTLMGVLAFQDYLVRLPVRIACV